MSNKIYPPEGVNSTPFNLQLQHFDMICGQVMHENRILKFVVVIACLSFLLSIGIVIFALQQPASIPVIITVDDFGEAHYIGAVSQKNYQNISVPENSINFYVKQFISYYYSVSSDVAIVRQRINTNLHFLTTSSADKFATMIRENSPYVDVGKYTKDVTFDSEPLKTTNSSYQVDFTVTTRQLNGHVVKSQRYRALITIKCLTPSADDIKINHLGIYITDFDFKDLN